MMPLQKTLLLSLTLALHLLAGAQPGTQSLAQNLSVGGQFYYGSFLTTEPKAAYLKDSYSWFGELYLQVQTNGSRPWQVANGLPQWGVGVQYGNLGSRKYMGSLLSAFPYLNLPLLSSPAVHSSFRVGAGLGWVEKPYNAETNHKNVLIGSHWNAFLHLMWQNEVRLSPRLWATAGLAFSHLSNGGSTLPNLGVNTPALQAGVRYVFHEPVIGNSASPEPFSRRPFYRVLGSVACKQYPWIGGERYVITVLNAEVDKRTSAKHQFGMGVMVANNPSLENDPSGLLSQKRKGHNLQAGAYLAYERLFGRLSLPVQLGVYAYNKDRFPLLYQQAGLRYQVNRRWSVDALLKTHLGKADYISAGIGYTLTGGNK